MTNLIYSSFLPSSLILLVLISLALVAGLRIIKTLYFSSRKKREKARRLAKINDLYGCNRRMRVVKRATARRPQSYIEALNHYGMKRWSFLQNWKEASAAIKAKFGFYGLCNQTLSSREIGEDETHAAIIIDPVEMKAIVRDEIHLAKLRGGFLKHFDVSSFFDNVKMFTARCLVAMRNNPKVSPFEAIRHMIRNIHFTGGAEEYATA